MKLYPAPLNISFNEILKLHSENFSEIMNRFSLEIDLTRNDIPTDERIQRVKSGHTDDSLCLLYLNYGRYLLLSSSICGELPANLQGKWNAEIIPPWESDYHFDINLQMNYWMAEPANMYDCAEALIKYVERFVPHAKKAAKDLYGTRGLYLPLQTDAWGISTPESYGYAAWIGSAAWIAQHFWNHYLYSGNIEFLRDRAYQFLKGVALFYEDYVVKDDNGVYQIMPSQSPENTFEGTGNFPVSIGISSAMDVQLAYDALGYAIDSAKILKVDEKQAMRWANIRDNLPQFKIGADGRILEWNDEKIEAEPGHRHLSHLYGLYPSNLFNPVERPAQYEAAIKSLEHRLSAGGGHTGWSRAWVACLYARAGNGAKTYEHMNALITDFATISLLDLHPPRIFQIDGNLGAVAAGIEAVAQYWAGRLHLLRALPSKWHTGRVRGLKVPGGHTVSFEWKDSKIINGEVVLGYSKELTISGKKDLIIRGNEGERFNFNDL